MCTFTQVPVSRERARDPLELELQEVGCCRM